MAQQNLILCPPKDILFSLLRVDKVKAFIPLRFALARALVLSSAYFR